MSRSPPRLADNPPRRLYDHAAVPEVGGCPHVRVEERIGPYRVLEELGVGGMGEVSLALDTQGRTVAVKVLHPAVARDEVARKRLEREVSTMRRVRSPNVAEVLDADFTARRPYIVTRYVQGRSLDEVVRDRGALRGAGLARVARGLARSLAAIHSADVVHRDLKPANVILVDDRSPVVIDFGLAHAVDATRLTLTGTAIGTPGYIAPEILDGGRATPAADIFSWAATVVFTATGRSPYGSGPPEAVFSRIFRGRHNLNGVPRELLPAVRAALARDTEKRPTSLELLEILRTLPSRSPAPPRPPASPRSPAPPRAPAQEPPPAAPDVEAEPEPQPERPAPDPPEHPQETPPAPETLGPSVVRSGLRLLLAVLPALFLLVPVPALAACLCYFLATYARDAWNRMRARMTGAKGRRAARLLAGFAALVAMPLEVTVRLGFLAAAVAAGHLAVFALARTALSTERAAVLAIGVLAAFALTLRSRYTAGAHRLRRIAVPAVAVTLLVVAATTGHGPTWWPFPGGPHLP